MTAVDYNLQIVQAHFWNERRNYTQTRYSSGRSLCTHDGLQCLKSCRGSGAMNLLLPLVLVKKAAFVTSSNLLFVRIIFNAVDNFISILIADFTILLSRWFCTLSPCRWYAPVHKFLQSSHRTMFICTSNAGTKRTLIALPRFSKRYCRLSTSSPCHRLSCKFYFRLLFWIFFIVVPSICNPQAASCCVCSSVFGATLTFGYFASQLLMLFKFFFILCLGIPLNYLTQF